MSPVNKQPSRGQAYWRSLDELSDEGSFREAFGDEFLANATDSLSSVDRRQFLKIMGASLALAGLTSCRRWPDEKIVPFSRRPEGRTPGVPVRYATAMELGGLGLGLLVTSVDGRPIKIDGNPQHPTSQGASSPLEQASILDLYDLDRARDERQGRAKTDWSAFETWLDSNRDQLRKDQGAGLRILCEATSSPSMLDMRQRMYDAYPAMVWHEYESVSDDNERFGTEMAFGAAYRPHLNLTEAKVIVSLGGDLLDRPVSSLENIRGFTASRKLEGTHTQMSRLYAFEGVLSLTGANADHRVSVSPADIVIIAARLALGVLPQIPASLQNLAKKTIHAEINEQKLDQVLANVVSDLQTHQGKGVVTAGLNQPPEVHLLAHLINDAIGAVGNTVTYTPVPQREGHVRSLTSLTQAMTQGTVQTLVMIGGNPAYDAPADLDFVSALSKVKQTIRLSDYDDETALQCTWFLPRAHRLETWGDVRAINGTLTVCQPLIQPLFNGHSAIELLAALCDDELRLGEQIVQRTFAEMTGGTFSQTLWRQTLHDGVLVQSAFKSEPLAVDRQRAEHHLEEFIAQRAHSVGMQLLFVADSKVYDGRFANNGWQQELPDALTKLTWDNALLLSIERAQAMGVQTGDMLLVQAGSKEIKLPALLMPGQHRDCAVVALGYGRRFKGRICAGAGFDVNTLRTTESFYAAHRVKITKTHETYPLAVTQNHHAIDVTGVAGKSQQDRLGMIFREADLDEYRKHPGFAAHRVHTLHQLSPYQESNLDGAEHRWAMSIDLNACIGCNGCITSCHAENNIPIVGKDQVLRGREMHWLRLDRYYSFDQSDGHYDATKLDHVALQPMTCQMCENAPCETVCPVGATMHDTDGLNVMVYNRCVGTRYCANNCNYKARRFNFFDYWNRRPHRDQPGALLQVDRAYYNRPQTDVDDLRRMQLNPDVTVRMRGVMEKCTFCTQRIEGAKIQTKNQWVQSGGSEQGTGPTIADGTIKTACEEACPAQAIIFGDLNDPNSRIAQRHKDQRSYALLDEFNVKPRVKYLAKVRNPIASDAHDVPPNDH